uniref:Uncharacterized protein n=2 Tax=Paenibacillus athensensis TaxID=1967502 RepID=A0A4Y8PS39_9BACL
MKDQTARRSARAAALDPATEYVARQSGEQETYYASQASPAISSAAGVSGLQRTVGNQAVAQLMRSQLHRAPSAAVQASGVVRRQVQPEAAERAPELSGGEALQRQAAASLAPSSVTGPVSGSKGEAKGGEADELGATAPEIQRKTYAAGSVGAVRNHSPAGSPVVQRQLFSYPRRGAGVEEMRPEVAALGEANAIFVEYAQLLKDDSNAIVKGKERDGNDGLKKVLKETAVENESVNSSFIAGLVGSGDWKSYTDFEGLRTKINASEGYEEADLSDMNDTELCEYIEEETAIVSAWLAEEVQLAGENVWAVIESAAALPAVWQDFLASVLYNEVKETFYDMNGNFVPYVQPFIKLINEINDGTITQLDYVRKYGGPGTWGAEFAVAAPAPKQAFYNNVAVVHTHYPDDTSQPNYGHTKPYDRRYNAGYGYTAVNLARLLAIADTNETYDNL